MYLSRYVLKMIVSRHGDQLQRPPECASYNVDSLVPSGPVLPRIKIFFISSLLLNDQHQIDIHGGRRKEETVETVQDAAVTGNDVARILDAGDPF